MKLIITENPSVTQTIAHVLGATARVYHLLRSNQKTICGLMIALRISIAIYSYQLSFTANRG